MLTPTLAQEIAADTSALIGFNVLITDGEGIVIGSGDRGRIGSFHEASVEVIRTQQPAAHNAPQAHDLRGVKPGITLPLVIGGTAVGTVGITGAPGRVRRFGLLVQRQTEILLQEREAFQSRLLRTKMLEDLVRDLTSFDDRRVDPEILTARAAELGYQLTLPRVVVVAAVQAAPEPHPPRPDLLRTLRQIFTDPQDLTTATGAGQAIVLHQLAPALPGRPAELCRRLVGAAWSQHRVRLRTGVGGRAESVTALHRSYQDGLDALRLGAAVAPEECVHQIDDLRVQQLLEADPDAAARVAAAVLPAPIRSQRDWPVLRSTIIAWCEHGFSLVGAAQALGIHRNTLLYRLAKWERLTGIESHDHRRLLTAHLACVADQLCEPDQGVAAAGRRSARRSGS